MCKIHKTFIFNIIFVNLVFSFFSSAFSESSNTKILDLHLKDAEDRFQKNNLMLLAARFQIDAKKAGIVQAKLWPNPTVNLEQNIYNPGTKRYFDFSRDGQTGLQVQQLFLLGNKIDKRVKLAELGAKMGEHFFYDLLRALKYELRTSFFQLYYLREALNFYDNSLNSLQKTADSMDKAYQSRRILLSELLRIKALMFMLQNERIEVITQIKQKEASLKVLLNDPSLSETEFNPLIEKKFLDEIKLDHLKQREVIEQAIENRPDIKLAIASIRYEEANVDLQKAYALPDISIGGLFQRANNYIPDYFGLTAQVNIPIFDRNQGNILAAEKTLISKRSSLQNLKLQLENEVAVVLNRTREKEKLYQLTKKTFTDDYKKLADQMIKNYEKRYLTIIEFADFYEAYRASLVSMLKLQTERLNSIEELNYIVGFTLIDLTEMKGGKN